MGFLENLLRGMAGGHHGKHGSTGYTDGHGRKQHDWGDNSPIPSDPQSGPNTAVSKACARCGAQNGLDARFCSQCGEGFVPGRCSACKAEIVPGMHYCSGCGKALNKP